MRVRKRVLCVVSNYIDLILNATLHIRTGLWRSSMTASGRSGQMDMSCLRNKANLADKGMKSLMLSYLAAHATHMLMCHCISCAIGHQRSLLGVCRAARCQHYAMKCGMTVNMKTTIGHADKCKTMLKPTTIRCAGA